MKGSVSMFFIETERLSLTPFKLEDLRDYFPIISDDDVKRYVPYASAYTLDTARKHLLVYEKGDFVNDFYIAIRLKKSSKIIGSIIAVRISQNALDISYLIDKEYRCKGYLTEAFTGFINYLNSKSINCYLLLSIENDNTASTIVAKKYNSFIFQELYNSKVYAIKIGSKPVKLIV